MARLGSDAASRLEIPARRDSGVGAERGDVCARRPVPDQSRDGVHRHLLGKVRQRCLQAGERAPAPERQAGVAEEGARERAAARADCTTPFVQRPRVAGIREERVGDIPGAGIRRRSDVDRRDTKRQQQVEEHRLGTGALLPAEAAVVEVVDELAEERAHGDRRRRRPVDPAATRFEVDGAEHGGAGCPRLVHRASGDPERPRRW